MARNPALGSFPKRIRRHEEEIRRLRLRDQRGELPHQRFWIDPGGDDSDGWIDSYAVTGGYGIGYHRAPFNLTSGDTSLAHWDSSAVIAGGDTGGVVIDQAGDYLVICHCELNLLSVGYPSVVFADVILDVNETSDTIDHQQVTKTIASYVPSPALLPVPIAGGEKTFAAGDTLSLIAELRAPQDLIHFRFAWGDGPAVGGLNTYLALILIG